MTIAEKRNRACIKLLADVHAIADKEGAHASALHAIKLKLLALAKRTELFPLADFAMPVAQGRTQPLLVEDNDGLGLYLTIGLPGKEAAPHDHGIWCVSAQLSGREHHQFFRRTDDGATPGRATVAKVGEVTVEPGHGVAMADHDIHSTIVLGKEPAVGLAVYGYALNRFPSVTWYLPQFGTVRTTASRRHAPAA